MRTNWDEDVNTIRARVGMPTLVPPPTTTHHLDSPTDAAFAAAFIATMGICAAVKDPDPYLVAARAVNAVVVAAATSTSHSHLAFVAAATGAESIALLGAEKLRDNLPIELYHERTRNAVYSAVDAAIKAAPSITAIHA